VCEGEKDRVEMGKSEEITVVIVMQMMLEREQCYVTHKYNRETPPGYILLITQEKRDENKDA
jgi:hypothetical protein